tara:strand:+ start:2664 stop:4835 length:2172 start_codon:yes stop_codon:yes gene_type:complete
MKKIVFNLVLIAFFSLIIFLTTLATIGIETNKFNKLISDKVSKTRNINLDLFTIKFKLDPKKLSLYLETKDPKINYKGLSIPIQNIKVYVDFLALLKSDLVTKKINVTLEEINVFQLKKLSKIIKPSNFKSFLNNKIKEGKIKSEIEIFLDNQGEIKNFIAKGEIKNLKAELINNLNLSKTNFNFFADKEDILIKNIFGEIDNIKISDGDMKLNFDKEITINSNFYSKIFLDEKTLNKFSKYFTKNNFLNTIKNLDAELNNNFSITFDETYKVKDYNYSNSGKFKKGELRLAKLIQNEYILKEFKEIYFSNLQITSSFNPNKSSIKGEGEYSFNNVDFLRINFDNNFKNDLFNLKLDFAFNEQLDLNLINYTKPKNTIANLYLEIEKTKNITKINKLNFKEDSNIIQINELTFKKKNLISFKNIRVATKNNDFLIKKNENILIKGKKFDATNIAKFFGEETDGNKIKNINEKIEIDFSNIKIPMSEKLQNFKLLGEIENGKFTKISSKGEFGNNNFLDISMKKDKNSDRKYLEIYSDLTRPLLTEYNFFKGLSGGKLLFTSIIENTKTTSKLKIENFKVKNAPGVVKLLSLADLGGLADLAEGEGLSFDLLEIDMEKNKGFLKLNEILALGPSLSVLMEGYQDKSGLTSLRGTLVPAKTLNNIISKIPVIGNIVIPKEAGEGLFGISFKMKGTKGNIRTTINPIRTLTPRFIQKIIDKNKKTK